MHISIVSPVTINILKPFLEDTDDFPERDHPHPFTGYLACRFVKMGHRVTCITTIPELAQKKIWHGDGLTLIGIPRRKTLPQMIDFYRKEVRGVRETLLDIKPDMVHAGWTYEYADAALSSGFPVLVTARDAPWQVVFTMRSLIRLQRTLYCQFFNLPRIRHMSTISPYMVKMLKRQCFYRRNIQVIPNGILKENMAKGPKTHIKDRNAPVICCVSGWGRLKNLISGISGFQKFREEFPLARLYLYGSGLGKGEIAETYCREKNLAENVLFGGYQSQETIRNTLRKEVDIILHTSLEESFGMTILDGMAQGLPCVGGEHSGAVPWLLEDGKSGLLLDVKDPRKICEGLSLLVHDEKRYASYAVSGYNRVLETFILEKVAEKYVTAFENILKNRN